MSSGRPVVAYQRLKTIENSKTVSRKSDRGRLRAVVVYDRFKDKALTEKIFCVLGRWSLMGAPTGGGRTWRFDCIGNTQTFHLFSNLINYLIFFNSSLRFLSAIKNK